MRRALENICVFVVQLDSSEALIRSQNYPLIKIACDFPLFDHSEPTVLAPLMWRR